MPTTLGLVSLGCAASAAVQLIRWGTHRTDSLGRPRSLPVLSVSLLTVVGLAAMVPAARHRIEERRLSRVATVLVGHPVEVHCQTTTGAFVDAGAELGFVRYDEAGVPEPSTLIKRDPCRALGAYLGSDKATPTEEQVVAVHVLTHEAMHMRGETNEAVTECEALQRDARTAVLLGASTQQARRLARTYWLTVYPRMPDDYRTPDCVAAGPLDEGLDTAPWAAGG